nr:hypothetical protein [uncultured Duganella sp.]
MIAVIFEVVASAEGMADYLARAAALGSSADRSAAGIEPAVARP